MNIPPKKLYATALFCFLAVFAACGATTRVTIPLLRPSGDCGHRLELPATAGKPDATVHGAKTNTIVQDPLHPHGRDGNQRLSKRHVIISTPDEPKSRCRTRAARSESVEISARFREAHTMGPDENNHLSVTYKTAGKQ